MPPDALIETLKEPFLPWVTLNVPEPLNLKLDDFCSELLQEMLRPGGLRRILF